VNVKQEAKIFQIQTPSGESKGDVTEVIGREKKCDSAETHSG